MSRKRRKRKNRPKDIRPVCVVLRGDQNYNRLFSRMFRLRNFNYLMRYPHRVDLVVFTGGADIHPNLYNGVHNYWSYTNIVRDKWERTLFDLCMRYNIKMIGICRGLQLLNVMAGGLLYQHVGGHHSFSNKMHDAHLAWAGKSDFVTSTHHQMVILPNGSIPIAWAVPKRADSWAIGPTGYWSDPPHHEIEGAIFPNINAVGVQFHPEMMSPAMRARRLYEEMISDFVKMSMEEFLENYSIEKETIDYVISKQWRYREGRSTARVAAGA
jgi:putative glutamine amidotransferase